MPTLSEVYWFLNLTEFNRELLAIKLIFKYKANALYVLEE